MRRDQAPRQEGYTARHWPVLRELCLGHERSKGDCQDSHKRQHERSCRVAPDTLHCSHAPYGPRRSPLSSGVRWPSVLPWPLTLATSALWHPRHATCQPACAPAFASVCFFICTQLNRFSCVTIHPKPIAGRLSTRELYYRHKGALEAIKQPPELKAERTASSISLRSKRSSPSDEDS